MSEGEDGWMKIETDLQGMMGKKVKRETERKESKYCSIITRFSTRVQSDLKF